MTIRATVLDNVAKSYSSSAHESLSTALAVLRLNPWTRVRRTLMLSRVFRDHTITSLRNIATASVQTGSS